MLRLQNGYFSSASMHARKFAASSNDEPRAFMLRKSLMLIPCSLTITFSGLKSVSTAEDGNVLLVDDKDFRAPAMMLRMATSSSPSPLQLAHRRSMSASNAPLSNGSGMSAVERWKLRSHNPVIDAAVTRVPRSA